MLFRACDAPYKLWSGLSQSWYGLSQAWDGTPSLGQQGQQACDEPLWANVGKTLPLVGALWAKNCSSSPTRALSGLRCINNRKICFIEPMMAPLRS